MTLKSRALSVGASPFVNYYDHYIMDYQSKTAHLTLAEHGAYLLMLHNFYSAERALPADRKVLFRLLRAESKLEKAAVESVIRQYWQEGADGLTNRRASDAVTEYRDWVAKQRANGRRGGKRTQSDGLANGVANGVANGGDSTSYTTYHTTSHTKVAPPMGSDVGVGILEKPKDRKLKTADELEAEEGARANL